MTSVPSINNLEKSKNFSSLNSSNVQQKIFFKVNRLFSLKNLLKVEAEGVSPQVKTCNILFNLHSRAMAVKLLKCNVEQYIKTPSNNSRGYARLPSLESNSFI